MISVDDDKLAVFLFDTSLLSISYLSQISRSTTIFDAQYASNGRR